MPVGRAAEIISVSRSDSRRLPRRAVAFSVFVRDSGAAAVHGRVTDLSVEGCRVEGAGAFELHSQFWLKLSGHAPIRAQVLWSDEQSMGCSFIPPLDEGTFENLVRAEPPSTRKVFT
jgi:hypothetical protein